MASWRLVGLAILMFTISGVLTSGLQGEFDSLVRHGVFSDKCRQNDGTVTGDKGAQDQPNGTTTTRKVSNDEGRGVTISWEGSGFSSDSSASGSNVPSAQSSEGTADAAPTVGCAAQKAAITQSINALTSLMNLVALPMGIVVDVLGFNNAALGATVVWTVAASASGLFPGIGWVWAVSTCVCASAGAAIFLSSVSGFLPKFAHGDFKIIHRFSSIFTAVWDMSGLLGVAMGYYLKIQGLSLTWLFLIYGLAMGIPSCVFMVMLVKKEEGEDGEEKHHAPVQSKWSSRSVGEVGEDAKSFEENQEDDTPKVPIRTLICQVLKTPTLYLLFMEGVWCVTFSYYVLANVEAMMMSKGGAGTDISWARQVIVFAVAGCGICGFLPGMFVAKVGPKLGIPLVLVCRAVLAVIFIAMIVLGDIALQFVALFVLGLWRVIGFSVIEGACVGQYVTDFAPILGTIFGLIWTPAGGVSIAVGGWATYLSNQNPHNFTWLAAGMAGASAVTSLAFAGIFYYRYDLAHADQEVAEKTSLLKTTV